MARSSWTKGGHLVMTIVDLPYHLKVKAKYSEVTTVLFRDKIKIICGHCFRGDKANLNECVHIHRTKELVLCCSHCGHWNETGFKRDNL